MPVSPTFGSVGDIISVCIVIKDVCKALHKSRGSSTEYQKLIAELWALDDVLVQAKLLCETNETSEELEALHVAVCRSASLFRTSIEGYHEKLKKFEPSLQEGGSKSAVRDVARKVQWQFSESQETTKFRAEIIAHCSALNVLLTTAGLWVKFAWTPSHRIYLTSARNTMKLDREYIHERLDNSDHQMQSHAREHRLLMTDLHNKVDETNQQIRHTNATTSSIAERLGWL